MNMTTRILQDYQLIIWYINIYKEKDLSDFTSLIENYIFKEQKLKKN